MRRGRAGSLCIGLGGALWLWVFSVAVAGAQSAEEPATQHSERHSAGSRCAWGPVTDVEAVRALLGEWVEETGLPQFQPDKWDVSIDRSNVWARLQLANGQLEVGWKIDDDCEPTSITIEPSPAYAGKVPDEDAVRRLVDRFRAVTVEKRPQSHLLTARELRRFARTRIGEGVLIALVAVLVWLLPGLWRRWKARGRLISDLVRVFGLLVVAALMPYVDPPPVRGAAGDLLFANAVVIFGILPLMAFLWLAVSGAFGYGSPRRQDWPALVVFLLALALREGYARHGIQELEIYFYHGVFPSRHSVVRVLFQMFLQPLADDPYWFMMHVNGVLGSLATLPLFLFVRQRTRSRMAATLVATFYAVHPIIVPMTPTDGPAGFLLATWFAGLALLTADAIGPRQLFGGAVLLGLAATCRAEGSLYLLASLLLLDVRALLASALRHMGAACVSAGAVLGLIAVHLYYVFPAHIEPGESLPIGEVTLRGVLRAGLYSVDFNDPIIVALVGVGALAGLVNKRLRIGLGAAVATLIVVWPVSMATTQGFTVLHRLVVVSALQVIAAGIGAAWITSWLPARLRHHWAAAIPAVMLALFVFAEHRHEVRAPNAVTEEFWMLRDHLAPGGAVNQECALLFVGRPMDTDIHNFRQVLPGMEMVHCEEVDCIERVSHGGCFYYLRSLNCFYDEIRTPPECFEHGRTPAGEVFPCIDPRCAELETDLELVPIEERNVDLYAAFRGNPRFPRWPRRVDILLYRVMGVREAADR